MAGILNGLSDETNELAGSYATCWSRAIATFNASPNPRRELARHSLRSRERYH